MITITIENDDETATLSVNDTDAAIRYLSGIAGLLHNPNGVHLAAVFIQEINRENECPLNRL